MANAPTIPLHLCQVLEEEYINLHQQLDPKPDWDFEDKHFKRRLAGFKDKLRASVSADPQKADSPLARYVIKYARKADSNQPGADSPFVDPTTVDLRKFILQIDEQRLLLHLNSLLTDESLYNSERFPCESLSEDLQELVELGLDDALPESDETVRFAGEDLCRFNRLLLENAWPDEIESIYELRLNRIISQLHERRGAALCLSGGGTRSGTFALGIIQGLARRGLLEQFNYLSTVSGGGYIGSWLSTWINRHPEGLRGVVRELVNDNPPKKLEPDPSAISYLRNYSNFLTPKFSALSADVWSFVAIYFRNLTLNWLVMIPLLMVILGIPRTGLAFIQEHPHRYVRWFFLYSSLLLIGYAIAYLSTNRPTASDALRANRVWASRTDQAGFLKYCLSPLVVAGLALGAFWAWFRAADNFPVEIQLINSPWMPTWLPWGMSKSVTLNWLPFVLFGCAVYLLGWVIHLVRLMGFSLRETLTWKFLPTVKAAFSQVGWQRLRELVRPKELLTILATGFVGGLLLWVVATKIFPTPIKPPIAGTGDGGWKLNLHSALYTCFVVPLFLLTFFFTVTVFVGITSRAGRSQRRRADAWRMSGWLGGRFAIEDEDREWLARFSGWLLIVIVAWSLFTPIVIFGPLGLYYFPKVIASLGGLSGLIAVLAGKSHRTPAGREPAAGPGWPTLIVENGMSFAAIAFLLFFASGLSLLLSLMVGWLADKELVIRFYHLPWVQKLTTIRPMTDDYTILDYLRQPILNQEHGDLNLIMNLYYPPWWFIVILLLALLAIGLLAAKLINLNMFSLHAGYRNRLIRTFLGASRGKRRRPDPFTGFDPADDTRMHELRPGLLSEGSFLGHQGREEGLTGLIRWLKQKVNELKEGGDLTPESPTHLVHLLSEETRTQIENYQDAQPPSSSLRSNLIADLNRILEQGPIYQFAPFSDLEVTKDVLNLIEEKKKKLPSEEQALQLSLTERNDLVTSVLTKYKESGQPLRYRTLVEGIISQSLRGDYALLVNRMLFDLAYTNLVRPLQYPPPLLHVVNTALNLVSGDKLAWQQRKAESFAVTPLHCGSLFVGYRRAREYGGPNGISLGTAAAISGAAASSNMGYHSSSPIVTFLLTLFNARLGWWLGNPGAAGGRYSFSAGERYFRLGYPNSAIYPIIAEAFGLTNDRNAYVLLSDGGHFENLGLYEMVLRRCQTIVVVDGGQDQKGQFEDLGNAVRKIRIDLGIPITFDDLPIYPRNPEQPRNTVQEGKYCAVGSIDYGRVDAAAEPGQLIYIKPAFYGSEPRDIYNYAQTSKTFPHETTADQFFDEPQFESHRALGSHIMKVICGEDSTPLTLDRLADLASQHCGQQAVK